MNPFSVKRERKGGGVGPKSNAAFFVSIGKCLSCPIEFGWDSILRHSYF